MNGDIERLTRERDKERKHVARIMRDLDHNRTRAEKAEAALSASRAECEGLRATLGLIAHTFVEDSHGGTKTLEAHEYQKIARDALATLSPQGQSPAKGEREGGE